jgi:hypothetical protein
MSFNKSVNDLIVRDHCDPDNLTFPLLASLKIRITSSESLYYMPKWVPADPKYSAAPETWVCSIFNHMDFLLAAAALPNSRKTHCCSSLGPELTAAELITNFLIFLHKIIRYWRKVQTKIINTRSPLSKAFWLERSDQLTIFWSDLVLYLVLSTYYLVYRGVKVEP